ncbi:MAG TPA: hypothetical protein VLM37_02145, partial [Fibrobacteraceae bacterium]|nr:hypothetical protein [Fibrobacteraceae bacterium]
MKKRLLWLAFVSSFYACSDFYWDLRGYGSIPVVPTHADSVVSGVDTLASVGPLDLPAQAILRLRFSIPDSVSADTLLLTL